jgi:DNA (cytosine-5)-methyltransferase 1
MRKSAVGYTSEIMQPPLSTLELCAGSGCQALGLEQAGIADTGLIEIDGHACATLRQNRPEWNVVEQDLSALTDASAFKGVDIVSGGLPCPPFSKAGKQLGKNDERNLFPVAINIVDQLRPRGDCREYIAGKLKKLGYVTDWRLAR